MTTDQPPSCTTCGATAVHMSTDEPQHLHAIVCPSCKTASDFHHGTWHTLATVAHTELRRCNHCPMVDWYLPIDAR